MWHFSVWLRGNEDTQSKAGDLEVFSGLHDSVIPRSHSGSSSKRQIHCGRDSHIFISVFCRFEKYPMKLLTRPMTTSLQTGSSRCSSCTGDSGSTTTLTWPLPMGKEPAWSSSATPAVSSSPPASPLRYPDSHACHTLLQQRKGNHRTLRRITWLIFALVSPRRPADAELRHLHAVCAVSLRVQPRDLPPRAAQRRHVLHRRQHGIRQRRLPGKEPEKSHQPAGFDGCEPGFYGCRARITALREHDAQCLCSHQQERQHPLF